MRRTLVVLVLAASATPASADDNDLVLSRLATPVTDGSGNVTGFVGQNLELRSLSSQLGTVLAPHLLTPADTIGFGGFQLTVDYAMTSIDASQPYWRVRNGGAQGGDTMRTVGLFMRKGMWFPLPSFELGGGAVHLVDSKIWTGQLYTKFALHEGYHQLPLPSLSVRGAVSRMMTQRELDLTVASLDVAVSKHFGVGGTWRFDPFVGWNLLMIIPRSEVIDPTPEVDPLVMGNEQDILNNFVFRDQDNIYRNRIFVGAKLQYYVFQLTLEAQFALKGSSKDDRTGTNEACMPNSTTSNCDATDTAATQRTLSMSAGFDF
ncbi:MAG TPA: hypothetical protein VMZ53_01020 [Kofleriaceae bacterium]|nr:hypothetical protein [Kofleriaceae bacterium]